MKHLFDELSDACSKLTTEKYSTSFSIGIRFIHQHLRNSIYGIYGFVRFADEIVDSFEGYNKQYLLAKFEKDTYEALDHKISLNPILNSFQKAIHQYDIDYSLIDTFLHSMKMDLEKIHYNNQNYKEYILGSAEVVGLMCLSIFTEGDKKLYHELQDSAKHLGAAFQKINFLRDFKYDNETLGRTYFPQVNFNNFSEEDKRNIENDIHDDLKIALSGIIKLPASSRMGVFLAYCYYLVLFNKIKAVPATRILNTRIRVSNLQKMWIAFKSYFQIQLKLVG